jgi:hypothetical protein
MKVTDQLYNQSGLGINWLWTMEDMPQDPITRAQCIGFVRQTTEAVAGEPEHLTREAGREVWL